MSSFTQAQMIRHYVEALITRALTKDDRGMTTETVILAAILSGAALLIAGAIYTYVDNKKGDIGTDKGPGN